MWELNSPWYELVIRALLVYAAVFGLLRFLGKKQIGQMSPFDLVLLLIISEAVSNSLIGEEYSLPGGLILAFALVITNYLVDFCAFKSKKVERLVEGHPVILMNKGELQPEVLNRQKITLSEFHSSLREHGILDLGEVNYAILETNGKISVIRCDPKKEEPKPGHSTLVGI